MAYTPEQNTRRCHSQTGVVSKGRRALPAVSRPQLLNLLGKYGHGSVLIMLSTFGMLEMKVSLGNGCCAARSNLNKEDILLCCCSNALHALLNDHQNINPVAWYVTNDSEIDSVTPFFTKMQDQAIEIRPDFQPGVFLVDDDKAEKNARRYINIFCTSAFLLRQHCKLSLMHYGGIEMTCLHAGRCRNANSNDV